MKYLWLALFSVLLIFSGCKTSVTEPMTGGFKAKVSVEQGSLNMKYDLEFNEYGKLKLTAIEPEQIKGFEFVFSNNERKISYYGIEQDLSEYKNLPKTFADTFYSFLITLKTQPLKVKNNRSEGISKGENFEFSLRPDGFLKTVNFPSLGIKAEISQAEYLF